MDCGATMSATPAIRTLRLCNDPRFARLCARLGLVAFWLASDQWPDCADEVPYDFRRACEQACDVPKEPTP